VGVHPCFVGPFTEVVDGQVRIHPGYDDSDLTFEGPGLGRGIPLEEPADGPTPDLLVLDAAAPLRAG
jgi:hypothetical protein